jgi:hypothetical protein
MGMLNKQKNIQIAALNARGMTVEAIAKKAGVDVQAVKESLEQRDRDYVELAAMSEAQKREYIANLQSKGKSVSEIAELTGLNAKKVNEIIFKKAEEELLEVGNVEVPEKKRGGHNKISELIKAKIVELKQQGKSDAAVAKELGIGSATVNRTWNKHKSESEGKSVKVNEEFEKAVDEMIEESKGKEITEEREEMPKEKAPETAKAAPSAEEKVLQDKDSTLLRKCQEELAIIMHGLMGSYTKMDDFEKRAFEIGCTYGKLSCLKSEIDNA